MRARSGLRNSGCASQKMRESSKSSASQYTNCRAERPVSSVTTQFLGWSCEVLGAEGKRVLLVVWDNDVSREVRTWIREHNRAVKKAGAGVRILVCRLPTKSP